VDPLQSWARTQTSTSSLHLTSNFFREKFWRLLTYNKPTNKMMIEIFLLPTFNMIPNKCSLPKIRREPVRYRFPGCRRHCSEVRKTQRLQTYRANAGHARGSPHRGERRPVPVASSLVFTRVARTATFPPHTARMGAIRVRTLQVDSATRRFAILREGEPFIALTFCCFRKNRLV